MFLAWIHFFRKNVLFNKLSKRIECWTASSIRRGYFNHNHPYRFSPLPMVNLGCRTMRYGSEQPDARTGRHSVSYQLRSEWVSEERDEHSRADKQTKQFGACKWTSKWTKEWPSTYVSILGWFKLTCIGWGGPLGKSVLRRSIINKIGFCGLLPLRTPRAHLCTKKRRQLVWNRPRRLFFFFFT